MKLIKILQAFVARLLFGLQSKQFKHWKILFKEYEYEYWYGGKENEL